MTVVLGQKKLDLESVYEVAVFGKKVSLSGLAKRKIEKAYLFLQKEIESGKIMYGVNTGFGILSDVHIHKSEIKALQMNLLRSHATGVGEPLEEHFVRAMLLLRANALCFGHSGVHVKTVQQIVSFLNHRIHPVVPIQGSVGASGDLAPLAHLALPLTGEGEVFYQGKRMKAHLALKKAKLKPITLGPKEGLALINGTQFMTALAVLAWVEADHLADVADAAAAMTLDAIRGSTSAFDPKIQEVRPHPGQIYVAQRMRKLLNPKTQISKSHHDCKRVQDPYCLRCIPQVHGASRDVLAFVRGVIEREVNSVTDNPLIFPKEKEIISGGNFHGQMVSMAMDQLSIAVAEFASISERRIEKMMNPAMSGLPIFLTNGGGLQSGFMMVQVAAASIVSENKTLCHPAVVDSISTNVDKEDHVSMGAWAARKANQVVVNVRRVIAMELMCAAQGIDLLRPLKTSPRLEKLHALIRKRVLPLEEDRMYEPDIHKIEGAIASFEYESVII